MKRFVVIPLLVALVGLGLAQTTRWDMHIAWPEGNYHTQGALRFAEIVAERSGGRLEIVVHAGGALGFRGPEVLRLVRGGTVPLAENFMENALGDEPIFGLFALPLTTDYAEAWELYQIAKPYFEATLARNNQILLYTTPWAPQGLYSQQEVRAPVDFRALRVRTAGENLTRFVDLLGATALTIPFGELYSALATGVINAVVTSPMTGVDASLWEVTRYFYPALVPNVPLNYAAVNRSAFERLAPEVQEVVLQAAAEIEAWLWETAQVRQGEAQARLEAEGMTIVTEVSDEMAAHLRTPVETLVAAWVEEVGADAEAILQAFRRE
jgi:TRAP-type C4-dicarboxylate transport system substrate-binding protein